MKKQFGIIIIFLATFTFSHFATVAESAAMEGAKEGMLIINEDNSHFFGSRSPKDMTLEGLHAFVDQYAGTKVTHLFLCPNAMRANFRSDTREAIWDPVNGTAPKGMWPENAKLLYKKGLDPYAVWIARCRQKNISPWISMRMNDLHCVDDPDSFMHSTFWRQHPTLRRSPGSTGVWPNYALNYIHPEVRKHQMDFVIELLTRYDMDGLELDWMRFGWHLTPGKEKEEAPVLTEFIRDVRKRANQLEKKWGHKISLAVRIPADPEIAAALGMDAVAWSKEGLVDLLVPCPFWTTSDYNIPIEKWREKLGASAEKVALAPGMEFNVRPHPAGASVPADLPLLYGFVDAGRARGAVNTYLFNWMDSHTLPVNKAEYRTLLEKGVGLDVTATTSLKRFPITFRDTVPKGYSRGAQLPRQTNPETTFIVQTGPAPSSGRVTLVIGLAGSNPVNLVAKLNGQKATDHAVFTDLAKLGGSPKQAISFTFPKDSLKSGANTVSVGSTEKTNETIVWLEIRVENK